VVEHTRKSWTWFLNTMEPPSGDEFLVETPPENPSFLPVLCVICPLVTRGFPLYPVYCATCAPCTKRNFVSLDSLSTVSVRCPHSAVALTVPGMDLFATAKQLLLSWLLVALLPLQPAGQRGNFWRGRLSRVVKSSQYR
jgi:hypothetical protein